MFVSTETHSLPVFLILFVYCCARDISGIINDLHNRFLVIKSLGVFKKIKANKQKHYETNKYTWTYFKINFNNSFNVKYIFVFTFKFWSCHMYSSFIELWAQQNVHLHIWACICMHIKVNGIKTVVWTSFESKWVVVIIIKYMDSSKEKKAKYFKFLGFINT